MAALPYIIQPVPNGPLILHRSGYLQAVFTWANPGGTALTLLVSGLTLEQGVPSRSGSYPDATGGHLFPSAQAGQPLSYYQGLLANPAALVATVAVPANGQSAPVTFVSAPLVPTGTVGGVFWIVKDASSGAQTNIWSPNVVNVLYS